MPDDDVAETTSEADAAVRFSRERELYDELSPDEPGHADVVLEKLMRLWSTEPAIEAPALASVRVPTMSALL